MIDERTQLMGTTAGLVAVIAWMIFASNWKATPLSGPIPMAKANVCAHIPTFDEWYRANGYREPPTDMERLDRAIKEYGALNYTLHRCQEIEALENKPGRVEGYSVPSGVVGYITEGTNCISIVRKDGIEGEKCP